MSGMLRIILFFSAFLAGLICAAMGSTAEREAWLSLAGFGGLAWLDALEREWSLRRRKHVSIDGCCELCQEPQTDGVCSDHICRLILWASTKRDR